MNDHVHEVFMASITTLKNGSVYIYVWDKYAKKQIQVPRELTKHLDGMPPEYAKQWLEDWEAKNGHTVTRVSRRVSFLKDSINALYAAYKAHRKSMDAVRPKTLKTEQAVFERLVLGYFIGEKALKDPKKWHQETHGFIPWLIEKGHGTASVKRAAGCLTRFGEYLVYSKYMTFPYVVKVPKTRKAKITPLKARIAPETVLSKSGILGPDLELAALLAYFGALEPSVLWALETDDFLIGGKAIKESKTYEGFARLGIGTNLSIVCRRSVDSSNQVSTLLKTEARYAVVNIWDREAAKRIAVLMRGRAGKVFKYSRPHMEKHWREQVRPLLGGTPHDMRRASCLYLGRTLRIPPTLLQEHARHAQLDTTMLYCRDPQIPDVADNKVADSDWDEVG